MRRTSIKINEDELLEQTSNHITTMNKTINVTTKQTIREKLRYYKPIYDRDNYLLFSNKTFAENHDKFKNLIDYTYIFEHGNISAFFLDEDSKKRFKGYNVLTDNKLNWMNFTIQFFYMRQFLLLNHLTNPSGIPQTVPLCIFPLYLSFLANLNKINLNWKYLKNHIFSSTYIFFRECVDKKLLLKDDIAPFTTKNIFAFYNAVIEHYFPCELFTLSVNAQEIRRKLEAKQNTWQVNSLKSTIREVSKIYFIYKEHNSQFIQISKYIENYYSNSGSDTDFNSHINSNNTQNTVCKNHFTHTYNIEELLKCWDEIQAEHNIPDEMKIQKLYYDQSSIF